MRRIDLACVVLLVCPFVLAAQQPTPRSRDFLVNTVGLTTDEMDTLTAGRPVVKIEETGERAEVLIFGAVFIDASPSEFVDLYRDLEKLEGNEGYLGLGRFSNPPILSDLADFTFVETDYEDLRKCRQQNCNVQLSTAEISQAQAID